MIVEAKILIQAGVRVPDLLPVTQIHLVIFDRTPQPFDKNIIKSPTTPIHTDRNPLREQFSRKRQTGKLTALIAVENLWLHILQGTIQRRRTECRVQTDRQFPTQNIATEPIHHRH